VAASMTMMRRTTDGRPVLPRASSARLSFSRGRSYYEKESNKHCGFVLVVDLIATEILEVEAGPTGADNRGLALLIWDMVSGERRMTRTSV
jgi:hypothetical protein